MKAKHWYDYLWVYAIIYFALGFFNILFAWLGMIDFLLPYFPHFAISDAISGISKAPGTHATSTSSSETL